MPGDRVTWHGTGRTHVRVRSVKLDPGNGTLWAELYMPWRPAPFDTIWCTAREFTVTRQARPRPI